MKKHLFTTILLVLIYIQVSGQQFKGQQRIYNDYGVSNYNTLYSRTMYEGEGQYITVYKVYSLSREHIVTIKATHQKDIKKVSVSVVDPNGGVFSHINTEETDYEEPSMGPFGIRGSHALLAGGKVPFQLALKFLSDKFENVKVVSVSAKRPGTNEFIYYIFNDEL